MQLNCKSKSQVRWCVSNVCQSDLKLSGKFSADNIHVQQVWASAKYGVSCFRLGLWLELGLGLASLFVHFTLYLLFWFTS